MRIIGVGADHLPGITAIYNDAVEQSTAIWNDEIVDEANRRAWLAARKDAGYPVLVAATDAYTDASDAGSGRGAEVLGYASFGDWRAFDGYRHTVEHSVYVRTDQRGRGIGRALLEALITEARLLGKHVMVAAVDASNDGSIALHERLGFERVGLMPQVGTKFGRWLDLALLQLVLDEREAPPER